MTTTRRSRNRRNDVAGADLEALKKATRQVLWHCGVPYSPNKIARLCITFVERVAPKQIAFADYLATQVELSAAQRRLVLTDPSLASMLTYADPTGEQATTNVLRGRRSS